jgi:hypothetical protein
VRIVWARQEVCIGVERFGEVWSHPVRQEFAKVRRGRDACGMFRQSRMGLFRCDAERYVVVWQSRSREVSFGEVWLGRFALERIGLDRQVRDRNGKAVRDRTGCVRSGRTRQSRTGSVRSNKARFGMAVRDGTGWNRCDMKRYGTKGASMNQIMVNAVEFDALLKEVEYLKHENQKLEEQLKDAQGRIRVLKEELRGNTPDCKTHPDAPHGFDRNASHSADRYVCECEGWEPPKREWVGLTKEDFYKKDDETVFVLGMKFAEARLKEKNT